MIVRTGGNNYYVEVKLDRRGYRAATMCRVYLVTTGSGVTLLGRGRALQGKKDVFNANIGLKVAFTRALKESFPNKSQKAIRKAFWDQYQLTHVELGLDRCASKFDNADTFGFTGHAPELKSFRCTVQGHKVNPHAKYVTFMEKGAGKTYPHQITGRFAHRKPMLNLNLSPSEIIWPHMDYRKMEKRVFAIMAREKAKREAYRRAYTPAPIRQQAEDRCHRVGQPKIIINNTITSEQAKKALELPTAKAIIYSHARRQRQIREWLAGVWKVADAKLTAEMLSQSLYAQDNHKKLKAALKLRPGVTEILGEYVITKKFIPAFTVGETVTSASDGRVFKVVRVDNLYLTLQPVLRAFNKHTVKFGPTETAFEWELEKQEHWLKRAWTWVTTIEPSK